MTVKQLKEKLNEFPDELRIEICGCEDCGDHALDDVDLTVSYNCETSKTEQLVILS